MMLVCHGDYGLFNLFLFSFISILTVVARDFELEKKVLEIL